MNANIIKFSFSTDFIAKLNGHFIQPWLSKVLRTAIKKLCRAESGIG